MAAIRHTLQREVCDPTDETLLGILHVTKPGKKKKSSFLCAVVTKEKPVNAVIHQVKKAEKESYKKKCSWQLRELLVVDGKDSTKDTAELDLTFERVYKWNASSVPDKVSFIQILWKLSLLYLPKQKPQFLNISKELLKQDALSLQLDSEFITNGGVEGATSPEGMMSFDGDMTSDYSAISAKEQKDLHMLMANCDSAVSNAQAFADQLSKDLSVLDGANIHSMMANETQVENLLLMIDDALQEASKIENRLDNYDKIMAHVKDTIHKMADKNKTIHQTNENNRLILDELSQIIRELEIPSSQEQMLKTADLSDNAQLPAIIEAADALHRVINAPIPSYLQSMQAVKEQKKKYEKLRLRFCQLVCRHLNNLIIHMANDPGLFPPHSGQHSTPVKLPPHTAHHRELIPYASLMHWLKDMDAKAYQELAKTYMAAISKLYDREIRTFFDDARSHVVAGRKLRGGSSNPDLSASQGRAGKLTSQLKQQAGTLTHSGRTAAQTSGRLLGADKENWGSELEMFERHKFDEIFEKVLSELEPVCLAEQEFCCNFFNLLSSSHNESIVDIGTPNSGDSGSVGGSSNSDSNNTVSSSRLNSVNKEVRMMMSGLFNTLEQQLTTFINTFDKADSYCCLYIYVRLSGHVLSAQDTGSFLSITFGSALVQSKRNFDRFMQAQLNSIAECKISKKKCGILPFVTNLEEFAKTCEYVFKRSERHADLEKWHLRLLSAMLDTIPKIAHEHSKGPQEVIQMENYHVLHQVLCQLKLQGTEQIKKEAKSRYQEALNAYVTAYFGRPLEKLNIFFEGVQAKVSSGVKESEIGYQLAFSKQELRKVIKDYPGKEVRKGLDHLYKKVDKHLCEEGNLLQVVWRAMQGEFIEQYKAIDELIKRCYPDAAISLEFSINDILAYFSDIAQSH